MPVLVGVNEEPYSCNSFNHRKISRLRVLKRPISPESPSQKKQNKNRYRSASLTAEAAMVLPLLFFVMYLFWQCFALLLLQQSICKSVAEAVLDSSCLGYVERTAEETKDLTWLYEVLVWEALLSEERVELSYVEITKQENGKLHAKVVYTFLCEIPLFSSAHIPVMQSFSFLPYTGVYDKEKKTEEKTAVQDVVYVTKYGTVYHTVKSCGYLSVKVTAIDANTLEKARNSSGKRYKECEVCGKEELRSQVYISAGGDHYHKIADCATLQRVFEEKKREEVTLPACTGCAGRENGT